jgi:hypothetical protein
MRKIRIFYAMLLIMVSSLSCHRVASNSKSLQNEEALLSDKPIGLRLNTMIEWTDEAHSFWHRVNFVCYNDIIIGLSDDYIKESGIYQYLLFNYIEKKVIDTITINNSSSPLLFYKSQLQNIFLMENHDATQRYKYLYGEGVSEINDVEFMSLIKGRYVSEAPHSESYIRKNELHMHGVLKPDTHLAWPEGLSAHNNLIYNLNEGLVNSTLSGYNYRATDWKVLNNKYVFMINFNRDTSLYGNRAYYVVRTLDNKIAFTIPKIRVPYLKNEDPPGSPLHDTFIDFSADSNQVLIKGMYNNKLCIMIYDIITDEEWQKNKNNLSVRLVLGENISSPLVRYNQFDASLYSVEPGTTTMHGITGHLINEDSLLYEKPDINSNVIIQLDDRNMHIFKIDYQFDYYPRCFEILYRSDTKTTINDIEDYWYYIIFESAINYKLPDNTYFVPIEHVFEMFQEYTGWVFGSNIHILEKINQNITILGNS